MKIVAKNKKANHDYFIEKTFEAGIVLKGSEIKSIRSGNSHITDSFAKFNYKGELFIFNMYVKKYELAHSVEQLEERRSRKLLLNKSELKKISQVMKERGFSVIPTKMYFKNDKIKVEIGIGKGKKNYDKRHVLKEKDIQRDIDKSLKNRY